MLTTEQVQQLPADVRFARKQAWVEDSVERNTDGHNIFTPSNLVNEILDKIPGLHNGYVLALVNVEFVNELLNRGVSPNWIFFLSVCSFKAKVVEKLGIPSDNIETVNSYTELFQMDYEVFDEMKFDVVVGNPPYQYGHGSNRTLFHKFYKLATDVTVIGGYVGFISPTTWMNSRKKLLANLKRFLIQSGLQSVTIINSKKVFGNDIALDSCGYTIQHKGQASDEINVQLLDGSTVILTDKNAIGSSEQIAILEKVQGGTTKMLTQRGRHYNLNKKGTNFDGSVAPNKTNQHPHPMINKINQSGEEIAYVNKTATVSNPGKWKVMFNYITSRDHLGNIIITNTAQELSHMCVFVVVNSEQQGEHLKQFLTSKLFRFVLPLLRPNTTNTVGVFREITLIDLTRSWTDAELYTHFNLTQDEIALIEETIK